MPRLTQSAMYDTLFNSKLLSDVLFNGPWDPGWEGVAKRVSTIEPLRTLPKTSISVCSSDNLNINQPLYHRFHTTRRETYNIPSSSNARQRDHGQDFSAPASRPVTADWKLLGRSTQGFWYIALLGCHVRISTSALDWRYNVLVGYGDREEMDGWSLSDRLWCR